MTNRQCVVSIFLVMTTTACWGTAAHACRELPYYQDYVCNERRDVYLHSSYLPPPPPPRPIIVYSDIKFHTYPENRQQLQRIDYNLDNDVYPYRPLSTKAWYEKDRSRRNVYDSEYYTTEEFDEI